MTTGRSLIHNGHNVGGAKTGQTVKVGKGTGHMGTNTIPGGRPTTASAAGHKTQDQGKTSKRAGTFRVS